MYNLYFNIHLSSITYTLIEYRMKKNYFGNFSNSSCISSLMCSSFATPSLCWIYESANVLTIFSKEILPFSLCNSVI